MFKNEFKYMEWVVIDINGWHLKENAPDNVKKAFDEYMKDDSLEILE